MNTLLLQPNDVLFFKDGRPMTGGLAGHGAAWPLPTVTNAALHAALWRAGLAEASHPHRPGRNGKPISSDRIRKFGSLLTAGPFPVYRKTLALDAEWFFPRPADAQVPGSNSASLRPVPVERTLGEWSTSLPHFLPYAVANTREPEKTKLEPWWSTTAYDDYLGGRVTGLDCARPFLKDETVFLPEFTVGIGMDPVTGTQDGERIYSAHYLRLHEDWRLGLLATCDDSKGGDLLGQLFEHDRCILVGGQQRRCTVEGPHAVPRLPLPGGRAAFTPDADGKCRVKWILLTSAVWPEIPDRDEHDHPLRDAEGRPIHAHSGGWLPNWVAASDCRGGDDEFAAGEVLLQDGARRAPRTRAKTSGSRIRARLVAACVPKAIAVTGYALPHEATVATGGAKPTQLAVPAGAVYYFETTVGDGQTDVQHAQALAATLNWHGAVDATGQTDLSRIKNRRSTLFGEKGFGLGVCGGWTLPPAS